MRYFKMHEFSSPDKLNSGYNMSLVLIRKLDAIREKFGYPIIITSGYRTKEHNKKLRKRGFKASIDSAHLRGLAVDIKCSHSLMRYKLIDLAIGQGINRFGVSDTFLHLDIDTTKEPERMWTY